MDRIDRNTAKNIVEKALSEVADFNDDIEDFTFQQFHPFHTEIFLNSLKNLVKRTECSDQFGQITNEEYFDVDLTTRIPRSWDTLSKCIDYVEQQHYRVIGTNNKIHLP